MSKPSVRKGNLPQLTAFVYKQGKPAANRVRDLFAPKSWKQSYSGTWGRWKVTKNGGMINRNVRAKVCFFGLGWTNWPIVWPANFRAGNAPPWHGKTFHVSWRLLIGLTPCDYAPSAWVCFRVPVPFCRFIGTFAFV